MRLFPFDDDIFVETSRELNLTDRAKLMLIIRDYDMDTDLIKNPKQKLAKEKINHDILRQTRNYDVVSYHIQDNIIDISDLEPLEIKPKENESNEVFNIRDFL